MSAVVSDTGARYLLGQELARGGEGAILAIEGVVDVVAKIYQPAPPPGYDGKLTWMLTHPPADPAIAQGFRAFAWPSQLLYDGRDQFVGFLMPRVRNAVPLVTVFNRRRRQQVLPAFDWRYRHQTARNLAASLQAIHERDYVVGDLNESNVLVTPRALVAAVDTDSFQVRAELGNAVRIFPCRVGKPEYTPPELQGTVLASALRRPAHDAFALAVLIFQLLMEGNHPFRAVWLGAGEPPPLTEKIRRGIFPYAGAAGGAAVMPPASAPPWDVLHPQVAHLMLRCFVDGHGAPERRPSPAEWCRTLDEAIASLTRCERGHWRTRGDGPCPWCRFDARAAQWAAVRRPPPRASVLDLPVRTAATQAAAFVPSRPAPMSSRAVGGRSVLGTLWTALVLVGIMMALGLGLLWAERAYSTSSLVGAPAPAPPSSTFRSFGGTGGAGGLYQCVQPGSYGVPMPRRYDRCR